MIHFVKNIIISISFCLTISYGYSQTIDTNVINNINNINSMLQNIEIKEYKSKRKRKDFTSHIIGGFLSSFLILIIIESNL